jgi:hypothetical protein
MTADVGVTPLAQGSRLNSGARAGRRLATLDSVEHGVDVRCLARPEIANTQKALPGRARASHLGHLPDAAGDDRVDTALTSRM